MRKIVLLIVLFVSLVDGDVFKKGKFGLGLALGTGYSHETSYTLVGVSANYFVVDNLDIGVAYRGWLGGTPAKNEFSLSSNYYFPLSRKLRPYAGAFIRDTFVSGYDDYLSYGARGGISMVTRNSYISLGYVYEEYSRKVFGYEVSTSYPEIIFGLSF